MSGAPPSSSPANRTTLLVGCGVGVGLSLATYALVKLVRQRRGREPSNGSGSGVPAAPPAVFWTPRRPKTKPQPRRKVTVRVPATSANLGPGFDTIGMAVDMWSEITVERADQFGMVCEGEGAGSIPEDETNLVCQGLRYAFQVAGEEVPPLKYHCINRIPFARGLGSSSAAIVGGLIAGLALTGHQLSVYGSDPLNFGGQSVEPEELLQLASSIEGHPDNVCPAIYGGVQLGICIGESQWRSARVPTPNGMQLVAFIPKMIGKTEELRACLSPQVSRKDAVFNVSRAAFLVHALHTGQWCDLRYGCQDALHQKQRGDKVYKHLEPMIQAALAAGAHGAFLSGAGPTVLAITSGAAGDTFTQHNEERNERTVADAMLEVAKKCGVQGEVYITHPTERGAHIVMADPPFSQEGVVRYRGDI